MSIQALNLVLASNLKQPLKGVAIAIASHLWDGDINRGCYPGATTLSFEAGVCVNTVLSSIRELARRGLFVVEASPGRRPCYWIDCAAFDAIAFPVKERKRPGRPRKNPAPGAPLSGNTPPPDGGVIPPQPVDKNEHGAEIVHHPVRNTPPPGEIPHHHVRNTPPPGGDEQAVEQAYEQGVEQDALRASNRNPFKEKLQPETQPQPQPEAPTPTATTPPNGKRRLGKKQPQPEDLAMDRINLDASKIATRETDADRIAKREAEQKRQLAFVAEQLARAKAATTTKINGSGR